MDPDQDCTMWTLGQFCDPPLDPDEVFERTDVMAGPAHPSATITAMVEKLQLGDGKFQSCNNLAAARDYMRDSMMERFAFGALSNNMVGHMVNAYRMEDGSIEFRDFQPAPHNGTPVHPQNVPGARYLIWPIKDAD
jgi:hypothetical protein